MSPATRELPLFPLSTVLFPGGPLPLRIFETRYLDMVRRCLREESGFGVVLITQGRETGGAPRFVAFGTEARIVDFDRRDDGLLGITCLGAGRFRVTGTRREPDGLNVGEVADVAAEPAVPVPAEFCFLADALRGILPELGDVYAAVPRHFDDSAWVGHRLAELLPLEPCDRQALLEMQDPLARLAAIAPLVRQPGD